MTARCTVKLDEDLSPMTSVPLVEAGYGVATVVGQGWRGLTGPDLWPRVVAEGVLFITADKGFGDIRAYPPGTHPGIIVLRADHESVVEYGRLIETVVQKHPLESLRGALTIVSPRGIRIRRAPGSAGA